MDGISYTVAVALLALAPHLGAARAKSYADAVARASVESNVDPWMLVAIGRVETNWHPESMGGCCGGLMSIHWDGWSLYAAHHGLRTDRRTLEGLALDADRSIRIAAEVLASMRRMCGEGTVRMASAYQSGGCGANAYGRRVARMASHYRAHWAEGAPRPSEPHALPAMAYSLGRPGPAPLASTGATAAAGP